MPKYIRIPLPGDDAFYQRLVREAPPYLDRNKWSEEQLAGFALEIAARCWFCHCDEIQDRLREERERDPTAF